MSIMHGGSHLGYVAKTHTRHTNPHMNALTVPGGSFLLCVGVQDFVSRWDGVCDDRLVRLGEHVLHHWFHVWTLGAHRLAVLLERYSNWLVMISLNQEVTINYAMVNISYLEY